MLSLVLVDEEPLLPPHGGRHDRHGDSQRGPSSTLPGHVETSSCPRVTGCGGVRPRDQAVRTRRTTMGPATEAISRPPTAMAWVSGVMSASVSALRSTPITNTDRTTPAIVPSP